MKNIILVLVALISLQSCEQEMKNYVSISGHFDGLTESDTLIKVNSRTYQKDIIIDKDGRFSDTLHIKEAGHFSILVNKRSRITPYLNIGDDLTLKCDVTDINNTIVFEGRGAETNNYLVTRIKEVTIFNESVNSLYTLDSVEFNTKVDTFKDKMSSLMNNEKIDTAVVSGEIKGLNNYIQRTKTRYTKQHALLMKLAKGKASPKFTNLENYKGGTTSLDDFNGKFVYIDVWATWCKPCLAQIPALKELEKKYHDKNIEFVSISTDKPDKHEAWATMIKEREMTGVQLYAGKNTSFMQEYQISTIPRFIFIDHDGNIVNANAPRPSSTEEIKKMFSEVGL